MKNVKMTLILFISLLIYQQVSAQNGTPSCLAKEVKPFNNCTAAFLNNKMMVDDLFAPKAKCVIETRCEKEKFASLHCQFIF